MAEGLPPAGRQGGEDRRDQGQHPSSSSTLLLCALLFYFLSSSLSPKGPFVATAAPSYNLFTECPFPDGLDMAVLLHTFSVIGLFLNCYHQTYLKSKQEKQTYRGWTQGLKLAEPSPQRVARRQRAPQPTRAEQIPLGLHFIL